MQLSEPDTELVARIQAVFEADNCIFSSLARSAGLNPAKDFRYVNLAKVDFGGSDIRGYDFTGSNLDGSIWTDAIYDHATIVTHASLRNVTGFSHSKLSRKRLVTKAALQTTIGRSFSLTGIGVHSGLTVTATVSPGVADSGFVFLRSGLLGGSRRVKASIDSILSTEFATVLGDRNGPLVSTAEHLLSALSGLYVDNAIIELDGPELPILDGSSSGWVEAILDAGIIQLQKKRRYLKLLKPIEIVRGDSIGKLTPYTRPRFEIEIEFPHELIGKQSLSIDLSREKYVREVARARTFGAMDEVSKLWSAGFALGASFENSVVFDRERLLNAEGLRWSDEPVRHKLLDAIGDFALLRYRLLARYRSVRSGHKLNHAILSALMADESNYAVVDSIDASIESTPGYDPQKFLENKRKSERSYL
jgi:UDP-3-O-[3-hydroxymyristoyl] N-acetylglucosamine deacetylase